uniref:bicaudal-D-related protein 2-like n=1 Tax=Centroberyx gerrardi TaxID=166262 RepID=UPI003AB03C44
MEYSLPFSVLNERLRPRVSAMEQLCSSLHTLEERQPGSLRSSSSTVRCTILSRQPEPKDPVITTKPEEPEEEAEQEDLVSDGLEEGADLLISQCPIPSLNLTDMTSVGEEELDQESSPSQTEESDGPNDLTTAGSGEGPEPAARDGEGGSPSRRSYIDGTLPDLIRSGRPLSRRRTLGPVSDTLKEVRREVELSRRRSLKLKAQVDRLQESRDGPGWSQHRERVTEEVLSILRLLHPLTEPESGPAEPSAGENRLDAALSQLQSAARKLAISHTKQEFKSGVAKGNGEEDSAILQQALRDRDEAMEKKKAMEAELLRSKTEMMLLNNQLLEAVQKRLELSLELEAWKEDVQLILHQQLLSQQQAEQAQRKPSRLGLLRRNKQPLSQRPTSFPLPAPATPSTNTNQIFISRPSLSNTTTPRSAPALAPAPSPAPSPSPPAPAAPHRNWRDRLRRGKNSRQGDQEAVGQEGKDEDGFQVVSLD